MFDQSSLSWSSSPSSRVSPSTSPSARSRSANGRSSNGRAGAAVHLFLPGLDLEVLLGPVALPPLVLLGPRADSSQLARPSGRRPARRRARAVLVQVERAGTEGSGIGRPYRVLDRQPGPRESRRAAGLGPVAVAQQRLEVGGPPPSAVGRTLPVSSRRELLERGESVAVEVVPLEVAPGAVRRVQRVREGPLARVGHGLDVEVLGRVVLPAVGQLVVVGVLEARVRADRQLEAFDSRSLSWSESQSQTSPPPPPPPPPSPSPTPVTTGESRREVNLPNLPASTRSLRRVGRWRLFATRRRRATRAGSGPRASCGEARRGLAKAERPFVPRKITVLRLRLGLEVPRRGS